MDWLTAKNALKVWVAAGTGLTAVWRDEANTFVMKPLAKLNIIASSQVGEDEIRWEYQSGEPDPLKQMQPTFAGNREFTLSVLVESRDQRPDKTAWHYLELLRTSMKKPTLRAALLAAGIAPIDAEGIVELDSTYDDRVESRCSMDIRFNAQSNETDTDESVGYLDKLEVDYAMNKEGGGSIAVVDDLIDGSGVA